MGILTETSSLGTPGNLITYGTVHVMFGTCNELIFNMSLEKKNETKRVQLKAIYRSV